MAQVVFLRGANVGGHATFKPSALVKELADLDLQSLGTAGTFVAHGKASAAVVRRRILDGLPFEPQIVVRPGKEIQGLVAMDPWGKAPAGAQPFVSVLVKAPTAKPQLPVEGPNGKPWEVRLQAMEGVYALCWQRGTAGARLYPNEFVEKSLGVPATTRGWPTILKIDAALAKKSGMKK